MSLEKFKKFIKKRSRTKKSHCNNVESLIDTDIAHESFSRLFDGPFSIPRTSTKNSIKQYYKSFKYFCIRFRPKKNPSHYESDHSNPIQQYDIFKDYENCTSTSLGDNSLLKSIGRVANRKSFSTVYLSFDEYINAVAASHSAPNLMPVSTISSAISTISLSLCKDSQAFTVSRSVSSATPDPNMSCTANLVNIVSKSEASYSSIAYTNKDTIFRNASGKMLANSVDLCHQQIDSVATNFTTKPEDRTGDCIPNCEPNASSTIFPSNNAQMTSNNTPLQNSSNHISNYHVNRLELEEVAQSPVLIVKPVRNIAEIINKKDSQEKRKIFSTTRKSFRDIFKLNKKKTALVSTAPNSTIFVDHKSDSSESEACSSIKEFKINNDDCVSRWDIIGRLRTNYFKKSSTTREECNRSSQYSTKEKNYEIFHAIDALPAGSQEYNELYEEIKKETLKFQKELFAGQLEEFDSSTSQSSLPEIAEDTLVDNMYTYKFRSLDHEAKYDILWQNEFHKEKNNNKAVDEIFLCIAKALHSIIIHNHSTDKLLSNPLYIKKSVLASNLAGVRTLKNPKITTNDIFNYMKLIFGAYDEAIVEHSIIGYLYLTRMLNISGQNLTKDNWEILIAATMLATVKFWDDQSLYTADFVPIFRGLAIDEVLNIERTFLNDIEFHLSVKCKEFAATYFYLKRWI